MLNLYGVNKIFTDVEILNKAAELDQGFILTTEEKRVLAFVLDMHIDEVRGFLINKNIELMKGK